MGSCQEFDEYWYLEAEANRFAAELLMPSKWAKKIVKKYNNDISKITKVLIQKAKISSHAATIKIKDTIESGYIFAALTSDNEVMFSGRSDGTLANPPEWGKKIVPKKLFPYCNNFLIVEINGFRYYWWNFNENIAIQESTKNGDWRKILEEIISDIGIPSSEQQKFKQSLNGIISFANSQTRGNNRTPDALYSAILQRVHGHSQLKRFNKHAKFKSFIKAKVHSLIDR